MSVFDWRAKPSEAAKAIKPSPKARANPKRKPIYGLSRKADEILRDRFGGAFTKAKGDAK
jgi:hypothetical protein